MDRNSIFRTAATGLALIFVISAAAYSESSIDRSLLAKGNQIPDIGTFMQVGAARPAGYSFSGQDVYFYSGASGDGQIYRITADGWPYQLTTFEDGVDVSSRAAIFYLCHDGSMAVVGASAGGSEQSQLFLLDTRTGQVLQLTHFENVQIRSVVWAPDDAAIFYRSNQENGQDFFIYRMEISSGEFEKVFGSTDGIGGYNTVQDLSKDGTKLLIGNYTSNVNNDLYLLNLATGEHQKLNEDSEDVYYGTPFIMPDNKTIWMTCNNNDAGVSRLASMTVGSSEVSYVNDGWIDPKWEIDELTVSPDRTTMAALYNENGYIKMKLRDIASGNEVPSPPLNGIIGGGFFDEDGNVLISFEGPTRAPDVWKWNPATEELKQLTFSQYAGIDRELFSDPSLIQYKSFDGLEIPAFLYLPPGYEKGKPIPFLVHAHGGPESQYKPYFIRNVQYMLLNGYGVLAPNPRGSSGYDREYIMMDNYKNRKNSLKDYKAGVEWLVENEYTQPGMIGIRGGSYGGYVVLGMITEYPDLFSAAIDIVGIANFKTFLENTKPYRRALRESEYGPLSDPEFLKEISPIHKAHLIKTPLLVIHGENDPRVPVGEARQIIAAVQSSGGVVDSLIFPDEGHGVRKRVNIIAEYRKQIEFLDTHLKLFKSDTD